VYNFQNKITQTRNVRCFCLLTEISYLLNKEMGGKVREVGEGMPVDIFDLVKKIEDLTVQEQEEDVDITVLSRTSDKVLAIQELRGNELKGYSILSIFPCSV